jgi:hypothetical protein
MKAFETIGNTMRFQITSPYKALENFRNHAHNGIDINFPNGTELHSVASGVVEKVVHLKDNIGNGVLVKFDDGTTGIYGHLSKVAVEEGQIINKGDLLGYSGNSGHVVGQNGGYHLHFGLKDTSTNQFVDPTPYADDLIAMSDGNTVEAGGIFSNMLGGYNNFADKVIGAQRDFVLQPLWDLIKEGATELVTIITINLPDIMMIVTCLAGLLMMFGFKLPKILSYYTVSLITAVTWLANASS